MQLPARPRDRPALANLGRLARPYARAIPGRADECPCRSAHHRLAAPDADALATTGRWGRIRHCVDLIDIDRPDDPLLGQVADLMATTLADPNIVLGLDRLQEFLAANAPEAERRFCVLAASAGDPAQVVGLTVFSYVPAANCGFSEYIVVSRTARGSGLGRRLFDRRKAILDAAARQHGQVPCRGLFIEVEHPGRTPPEFRAMEQATALDAWERLKIFDHLGFRRVDLAYVQPPLAAGKAPVDYLYLLFASWTGPQQHLPARTVLDTVRPIWASWAAQTYQAHYTALSDRLGDRPVALRPLFNPEVGP